MALFPYEVNLADGRRLWVREHFASGALTLQVEGDAPCPIDDHQVLERLALVIEYSASKLKERHAEPKKPKRSRART
jgi:hypothetical protein